jgi:hypothetical protein
MCKWTSALEHQNNLASIANALSSEIISITNDKNLCKEVRETMELELLFAFTIIEQVEKAVRGLALAHAEEEGVTLGARPQHSIPINPFLN